MVDVVVLAVALPALLLLAVVQAVQAAVAERAVPAEALLVVARRREPAVAVAELKALRRADVAERVVAVHKQPAVEAMRLLLHLASLLTACSF